MVVYICIWGLAAKIIKKMEILIVVYVIFGILALILFFKVWGMTTDISKIKNRLFHDEVDEGKLERQDQIETLRSNLLAGDIAYVKQRLLNNFYEEVRINFKAFPKDSDRNANLSQSIRPLVDKLQKQFDKIGEELPNFIKKMETYNDYYNIFTIKDFE